MHLKFTQYFFTTKGSAFISTLVATGLLAISSISLIQYMTNFQKTTDNTINTLNISPLLQTEALYNLKTLLIGRTAKGHSDQSQGICSLVNTPAVTNGVDNIKIQFQNVNTKFDIAKWKSYFPETRWMLSDTDTNCQKIDSAFVANSFTHCFKKIDNQEELYIIAQIIPRLFPTLTKIDVTQGNTKIDIKNVVFQLKVSSALLKDPKPSLTPDAITQANYINYQSDILWASAVGECYLLGDNGDIKLITMSATGLGSSLPKIMNSLKGENLSCKEKLTFTEINNDLVQIGQQSNLLLSAAVNLNARLACTKSTFSCRKSPQAESNNFDDFVFSFGYSNHQSLTIPIKKLNITLKKNKIELDGTKNEQLDNTVIKFLVNNKEAKANSEKDINFPLYPGSHGLHIVSPNIKESQIASHCQSICNTYDKENPDTYTYPVVKIYEATAGNTDNTEAENNPESCTFEKDFSNNKSNRVRCIVCHTKACHRFGLGTFGPLNTEVAEEIIPTSRAETTIYGLNEEALDSQLPECEATYSYKESRLIPTKIPATTRAIDASGKRLPTGMVVELSASNIVNEFKKINNFTAGSVAYKNENAKSILPVLCFSQGKFLPAMQITKNNINTPPSIITSTFEGASKVCENMGREVGNQYDLAVNLSTTYTNANLIPVVLNTIRYFVSTTSKKTPIANLNAPKAGKTNLYTFINHAKKGLFIAPSEYNNLGELNSRVGRFIQKDKNSMIALTRLFPQNAPIKLWVAAGSDIMNVNSIAPPVAITDNAQKFSIFYDKNNNTRLILLEDTNTNTHKTSKYVALTYNIRWKGLTRANQNTRLKFVCYSEEKKYFLSKALGTLNQGSTKCKNENAVFVVPTSGMDWTKLMLALNPNDASYSFPNPIVARDTVNFNLIHRKKVSAPMAWVALELINKNEPITIQNLRLYKNVFSATKSIFRLTQKSDILSKIFTTSNAGVINIDGTTPNAPPVNGVYHKMCYNPVARNFYQDENLIIVPTTEDCPTATPTAVNIESSRFGGFFKPMSYTFASLWIKKTQLDPNLADIQIKLNTEDTANPGKPLETLPITIIHSTNTQ